MSNLQKLRSEFESAFARLPKVSLRLAALIIVLGACRAQAGEEQAPIWFAALVVAAACLAWEARRVFHRMRSSSARERD